MNFASVAFVVLFLPVTLAGFYALRGEAAGERRLTLLLAASALFYASSGLDNLLVLAGSAAVTYMLGSRLTALPRDARRHRMLLLWTGVIANLGLLLGFKIRILFVDPTPGFSDAERILVPLALSFVTFHQIGFLAGCARGTIRSVSLRHYLFFILFFPQLILGPIARYEDMDRQLRGGALARVDPDWLAAGLGVFAIALFKKAVIADWLAAPVNNAFGLATGIAPSFADAWTAAIAFQFQLFFDFTAYGEMAIGLAMMVGMRVPLNFDRPLFARDRADLWRRWHISFATFIRANVFLPLARHWRVPIPAALAITGMLSGLWHGLGPTFVVWGLAQTSILLWIHVRHGRRRRSGGAALPAPVAILATFATTCLLGVLFRSPDLASAGRVYGAMLGLEGFGGPISASFGLPHLFLMGAAAALIWGAPDLGQIFRGHWHYTELRQGATPPPVHALERYIGYRPTIGWGVAAGLALAISLAALAFRAGDTRFVYAQF